MTEVVNYQQQLRRCRELARAHDQSLEDAIENLQSLWRQVPQEERFGLPAPLRALPA